MNRALKSPHTAGGKRYKKSMMNVYIHTINDYVQECKV